MIEKEEFEKLIFEGLRKSYLDAYSFTGQINSVIRPEYLITVNIAQSIDSINKRNKDFGSPLIIKLEEPTYRFAMACVPLFSDPNSLFNNDIRGVHDSEERPGRVDLAIYEHTDNTFDKKPYAVIEVKGFVNNVAIVKKDLERNLEFHGLLDNKTGASRLDTSYMVFIHQHEKCVLTTRKQEGINKLKGAYRNYLSNFRLFNDKSTALTFRVEADTIAEHLIDPDNNDWPEEVLQGIYEESYHYIGVLLVIEKLKMV